MTLPALRVRRLAETDYLPCWQAMKALTDTRTPDSPDELWVVEHPPVFTLGQAGKPEHILGAGDIPVVQCDRGGQVTYHGPGQTVIYLMLDLHRMGIGARALVTGIENAIVAMLADLGLAAASKPEAPGVYVDGAKIASLGLRIRHGRSYHGLSLNRDMDMTPYQRINPCGYAGQPMTSLAQLAAPHAQAATEDALLHALAKTLALTLPGHALTALPAASPAATLAPEPGPPPHDITAQELP
ncbi:lipoyl(octanoyl) transferase LipB [Alcanivorax sp. JB21]|uniref:lipoyl(octanoyl) transferase LipB n=1 Tax=Alcanivorax limicola TaxID=2874102 RepID=UPI001CBDF618|nr:lipoyl(octanoyl) transferase LipB [Alcanivorax limicola]MBZ2190002.1 lipoyl(octanoyl) transferase LipB [Alcanivorax limicola]